MNKTPNYFIKIEGQRIPVPSDIGSNDEQIRNTFSLHFEGIRDAKIERKPQSNGDVVVEVCKLAGPKG